MLEPCARWAWSAGGYQNSSSAAPSSGRQIPTIAANIKRCYFQFPNLIANIFDSWYKTVMESFGVMKMLSALVSPLHFCYRCC
jgi:hypothetical protein